MIVDKASNLNIVILGYFYGIFVTKNYTILFITPTSLNILEELIKWIKCEYNS